MFPAAAGKLLTLKASILCKNNAEGFHTIQEQSCRLPYYSRTMLKASILFKNKAEGFHNTELMLQS
jgi:hypothetical protein